ncbi:MAG: hypothetical protein JEZ03_18425 [Bacteroidales bacterium]|nr:hypothetical protein [Bacteroidales bacterium]
MTKAEILITAMIDATRPKTSTEYTCAISGNIKNEMPCPSKLAEKTMPALPTNVLKTCCDFSSEIKILKPTVDT